MEIGSIQSVDIDAQMRAAYLDYAMSVIVARALPDARDGLKPVHRRILYAMHDMGIRSNSPFKKSARIVGEVLGKYHPHGDLAVYEAMARLAQDFSMRYPLVEGQGNFGSIDGDPPAAMRYTEARLDRRAEEMLADIDKNTVDFGDNFDGSLQEPAVLPARLPNLLLNGSQGIAVGMATNIPPHNLRELAAAISYLIDHYDAIEEVSIADLMKFIPGPDFPTGGVIVGAEGISEAYASGRGRLVVRGLARIEDMPGNRHRIIISQIPYQLNKTTLIERIAELARSGRLEDVSDLRDESDRHGMSIVIELRRSAQPKKVLNQLYKYTPLQSTFGVQMLALVDNEPRLLSLKRALQLFIEHRRIVITRRSEYELAKARERAHILDGLLIALAHLDDVIATIRQSNDAEHARQRLIERFKLSEAQAQAILDMQLRRLAALERQKIEDERRQVQERIAYLEALLADQHMILEVIRTDLTELADRYGDERRTLIAAEPAQDLNVEDLIPDEAALVSITQRGYVKRTAAKSFKAQARGGRGVTGHTTREEDEVLMLFPARTLDTVLFFSDKGKVYSEKAYNIPDAERTGRGTPMVNVLALDAAEKITAALAVAKFDGSHYVTMITRRGKIKRMSLAELAAVRPSGLIAITLEQGDELGWVRRTDGKDEILLLSEHGQALRFSENEVRPMGRGAGGVNAMRLAAGDFIAGMEVIEPKGYLVLSTTLGYGKRAALSEYPTKSRGGQGVRSMDRDAIKVTGPLAAARIVQEADDLTFISSGGVVLRMKVKDIPIKGRASRGVRLIALGANDSLASLARIAASDLKRVGAGEDNLGANNGSAGNGGGAANAVEKKPNPESEDVEPDGAGEVE